MAGGATVAIAARDLASTGHAGVPGGQRDGSSRDGICGESGRLPASEFQ